MLRGFTTASAIVFFVLFPLSVSAGTTPNLTNIGYVWNGTSIAEGGIYDFPLNTVKVSTYSWAGGNAFGDLYKGIPGNAVTVNGHSLGSSGSGTEFSDKFLTEGDYFVVIYNIPFGVTSSWIFEVRDWFKSGTTINPSAHPPVSWGILHFKVGVPGVELYTQIASNFPSRLPEDEWADISYANGRGELGDKPCGNAIAQCGCALTSAVMIARYYGITSAQGKNVDPLTLNNWLNENGGYTWDGGIDWYRVPSYTDWRMRVDLKKNISVDFPLSSSFSALDAYLASDTPAIAWSAELDHFFVIDGKLADTYSVKDPRWYNTETLNDAVVGEIDYVDQRRAYNNNLGGLRVYARHDGRPISFLSVALGSPAELFITDSQGRRLGIDGDGVSYEEIPNSSYGADHVSDPDNPGPPPSHISKMAYVQTSNPDEFDVRVIGTGAGEYHLQTTFADLSGNATSSIHSGTIRDGQTIGYTASFDPTDAYDSEFIPPPVPKIPLTITAENKTILVGAPIPAFTATFNGFVEGESLPTSDITGDPACSSATLIQVGTTSIICTLGTLVSDKYEFSTFVPGVLSILYQWSGFLQPIDDATFNPSLTPSVFKAGSTIPVKFQIKDANGISVQSATAPAWLSPQKGSAMNAAVDESTQSLSGTPGSTYRWDSTSQQYIYNWSTKGLAAGYWYRIYAQLDDGQTYSVVVGLK